MQWLGRLPTPLAWRAEGGARRGSADSVRLASPADDLAPRAVALSVVIPVFNGAAVVAERIRAVLAYLDTRQESSELVVVDDGSTDDTRAALMGVAAEYDGRGRLVLLRHARNRGKGAAIITGMRAAHGGLRVFVDADHSYPPAELARVVDALNDGADVAVASRVHAASRLVVRPGNLPYLSMRFLVGRVLHWLVRTALRLDLRDTQAGLKGFRGPIAERLFEGWLPSGFSFDLALLLRARRLGWRIDEVPVTQYSLDEPTTVRLVRDTIRMVRDVVRIRLAFVEDHFEAWDSALRTHRRAQVARLRTLLLGRSAPPLLLTAAAFALFILLMARHVWGHLWLGVAGWTGLIGIVLLNAWRANGREPRAAMAWFANAGERRVFASILLVGAILRGIWLADLPPMMHGDSAWCGYLGLMTLRGQVRDVFDFSGWYYTPYLSFLPYTLSFLVNGISISALRLPSALFGTLVMPPLYFLTRAWLGRRPAALATFLYAVGHASIHFSRIGLWNVQVALYGVTAFACIVSGLRWHCRVRMACAGVLSGLALYSYTGGRQIVLVIALFLGFDWLRTRRVPADFAHYCAALLVTIVPLIGNYVRDPAVLQADRTAAVWALSDSARPHVEQSLGVSGDAAILRAQISRTLRGFVTLGDASTQYETTQPILSWPTAILAAIGVLAALRRWHQPRFLFLLLWLGLGLLLGSVLIIDPPSFTRFVLLFPAVYIVTAVGLEAVLHQISRRVAVGRIEVALATCLLATQAAIFNLSGYYDFTQQMARMPREWDVLRVVERVGGQHDIYLFTGPLLLADSSIFQLFSGTTRTVSGFTASDIPPTLSHDTTFILTPQFRGTGRVITERFPGVEREEIDVHGVRQLAVYRCTTANACRGRL